MADVPSHSYMYFIILTVNFGIMSKGMFNGWISPSLLQLRAPDSPIPITADQASWIASLTAPGEVIAAILARNVIDIFGRQRSLLFTAIPSIISWIMTGVATTPEELYVARFIAGMAYAIYTLAATIYLAEVTPARLRGLACGLVVPSSIMGDIVMFAIGPRLMFSTTAWISLIVPLSFLFLATLLPESPYFLVMRGRFEMAEKSLRRLRDTTEVSEEMNSIKMTVEMSATNRGGFRDLLTSRSNLRILGIAMGILAVQQWSGMQAVSAYAMQMYKQINQDLPTDVTILALLLMIASGTLGSALVDRTGKKPLLLLSTISIGICTSALALFFTLKSYGYNVQSYSWIPIAAVLIYSPAFSLGLAPISFIIVGESFPMNVKAACNCVYNCAKSLHHFLIAKGYQVISDNLGVHYSFWGFTICMVAGVFFIVFLVPETKGKTLGEIQRDFQKVSVEMHKMEPLIVAPAEAAVTSKRNVEVDPE